MNISYRIVKEKIVICKDEIYFPITKEELPTLKALIEDIETEAGEFYQEDARKQSLDN